MSILSTINDENPWWQNKNYKINESEWPIRDQFASLKLTLNHRQIISIVGLRRTGKSTLLNQLLGHIIQESKATKSNPKNILYMSFEENLQANTDEYFLQILDCYFKEILEVNPKELKQKVYIFLDEIQYVNNWQDILKKYYDKNQNIKFIISGSFALKLINKDQESLAGRIEEYYIPPLNFQEYLRIKYQDRSVPKFSFKQVYESLQSGSKLADLKLFVNEYQKDFDDFILHGQFPELVSFNEKQRRYQYIEKSILNRVLEQDIPKIYDIDKINEFKIFCLSLIQNTGAIYELQNLCSEIGLSEVTATRYLNILKSSFMLDSISTMSKSIRESNRSKKKIYALSPNFTAAILSLDLNNPLIGSVMGHLVENYAYQRLKEFYEYIAFYRKGEKEIDFACGTKIFRRKDLDFIEVKYKEKIGAADLETLDWYMAKNKITSALILNKNILKVEERNEQLLFFIPVCLL